MQSGLALLSAPVDADPTSKSWHGRIFLTARVRRSFVTIEGLPKAECDEGLDSQIRGEFANFMSGTVSQRDDGIANPLRAGSGRCRVTPGRRDPNRRWWEVLQLTLDKADA